MENHKEKYKIIDKKILNSDTFTLSLVLESGEIPTFIPGQYINIFFDDLGTSEGKAYSLSSAPTEKKFDITIKVIGTFSEKLNSLKVGDEIQGTLPYGFFYSEERSDLVLISAGIGITPFRSMIIENQSLLEKRKISLIHSVKEEYDLIFKEDFERINSDKFRYIKNVSSKYGRLDQEKLNLMGLEDKEFMICGSISFVRDMWKILVDFGISQDQIYTEAFFSH